ncbi:cytochrome c3 family protein [Halomonas sp. DQ26W]|uniref:cytochrome c3 family protein n=1 Tax=Halomonas sp. DQ26W TaxID=2282311 RepID=UPI001C6A6CFE|nr:cytochrome c3 family protein [Halomonas sp. DQ26W]
MKCRAFLLLPFLLLLFLLLVAGGAQAQSGMQQSPHNMAAQQGGGEAVPAGDREVCMACHTPSGRADDVEQPLWQSAGELPERGYKTVDVLARSQGAEGGDGGSISLACLACHDGSQAQAVGGLQGGGARSVLSGLGGTALQATVAGGGSGHGPHPVGIAYARGQFNDSTSRSANTEALFAFPSQPTAEYHPPQRDVIDEQVIWWMGGGAVRGKEDIHLYTRPGGDGEAIPYVECASCHDPHSLRENLLRRDNSGSGVCRACHAL